MFVACRRLFKMVKEQVLFELLSKEKIMSKTVLKRRHCHNCLALETY